MLSIVVYCLGCHVKTILLLCIFPFCAHQRVFIIGDIERHLCFASCVLTDHYLCCYALHKTSKSPVQSLSTFAIPGNFHSVISAHGDTNKIKKRPSRQRHLAIDYSINKCKQCISLLHTTATHFRLRDRYYWSSLGMTREKLWQLELSRTTCTHKLRIAVSLNK